MMRRLILGTAILAWLAFGAEGVTAIQLMLLGVGPARANAQQAPAWGSITGTLASQADLQSALNSKGTSNFSGSYPDLTNIPATFAPAVHAHTIADSTGLQAALDAKASTAHAHVIGDVTNLQTSLTGKSDTS